MELKLGAAIKKLRTDKGVTQEALADYIGVSFQAVSKWETDTTMPDITLLPKLAVFFGVRIDDLFSVNTDDELERIDHILWHEGLTDESYSYAKHTLDSILRSNENDVGALKRYAQLYMIQNGKNNRAACKMLEKAMVSAPLDEQIFFIYRQICGGDNYSVRSGNDGFIRVCEPYAKKYPENERLREQLADAMIEMRYFDRAEEYIALMRAHGQSALADIFSGDIELARDNIASATALWLSVDTHDHKGQYEVGERFNRLGDYDSAIKCFENSFAAAEVPRNLSAVYSLAFLYAKLGRNEKAIESWRLILDVLASDYKITDGEEANWPKREIEKLEKNYIASN